MCSCLPSLMVLEMPPPQVAVRSSCLFFPASFQDLFCLSLPAVSLVWNIFSSLYPIGFKLPAVFLTSGPEHNTSQGQSALLCISAKSVLSLFCLIFSIFSYSSYPWVYLGILGYVIILSVTAVCLEQRRYIKHEFFLIPGHSSLPNQVFMSSGY